MKSGKSSQVRVALGISIFGVIASVGMLWIAWPIKAADDDLQPDLSLSAFMRKKLDASSQILEGLTVEDSELIERGAKALLQLSKVEKWQMLVDSNYLEYSVDFRTTVKKLANAAENGNFDNAALQWFDVMKGCIECHQHVRRERTRK